ncbi:hypothetical protein ACP26L_18095 [Paenibacillus sp. S-38]|uniref:hypothetical protein n=1 Tax=Paenibacillus sp. S-38 TaxID=3416710 RepID=UPI003CEB588C
MTVYYYQLVAANHNQTGYAVAKELAKQTLAQFGAVRGSGVGIGPGSCCAAVAVEPSQNIPAAHPLTGFGGATTPQYGSTTLPYGVVFGNSQLAQGGLDLGPLGGHAERATLTAAGNYHLQLYLLNQKDAILYVELTPCSDCQKWLSGGGGGVPNPFNFSTNHLNLHVWWSFNYPGTTGVDEMNQFHNDTLPNQLTTANSW